MEACILPKACEGARKREDKKKDGEERKELLTL
jgi:hypothetical protein